MLDKIMTTYETDVYLIKNLKHTNTNGMWDDSVIRN